MRFPIACSALLCLGTATAFAADPVGSYTVEGDNPGGGSAYRGTVTVSKTGETFRVVWVVGGKRYVGTGIGNQDFIAVSYRAGNETGLALYGADGDDWIGIWTYADGTRIGPEAWKRN